MRDVIAALAYVRGRLLLGQLARLQRSPWILLAIFFILAITLAIQFYVFKADFRHIGISPIARAVAIVIVGSTLCFAGLAALRQCPMVISVQEVAWVVPHPSGPRALVAFRFVESIVLGVAVGSTSAFWAILLRGAEIVNALKIVMSIATIFVLTRCASYGTYLVKSRGVSQLWLYLLWLLAMLSVLGGGYSAWHGSGPDWRNPLAKTAQKLTSAILLGEIAWGELFLLLGIAAALVGLIIRGCIGYQFGAVELAWQIDQMMRMFRENRLSGGILGDLAGQGIRQGVPSLQYCREFDGPRAMIWRAWAQQRRLMSMPKFLASISIPFFVAVLVSVMGIAKLAVLPMLLAVIPSLFSSASSGLSSEIDRSAFWLSPGSPSAKALASLVVPFAEVLASLFAAIFPMILLMNVVTPILRLSFVLSALGLAGLATAAGCLSAIFSASFASRTAAAVGTFFTALLAVSLLLRAFPGEAQAWGTGPTLMVLSCIMIWLSIIALGRKARDTSFIELNGGSDVQSIVR